MSVGERREEHEVLLPVDAVGEVLVAVRGDGEIPAGIEARRQIAQFALGHPDRRAALRIAHRVDRHQSHHEHAHAGRHDDRPGAARDGVASPGAPAAQGSRHERGRRLPPVPQRQHRRSHQRRAPPRRDRQPNAQDLGAKAAGDCCRQREQHEHGGQPVGRRHDARHAARHAADRRKGRARRRLHHGQSYRRPSARSSIAMRRSISQPKPSRASRARRERADDERRAHDLAAHGQVVGMAHEPIRPAHERRFPWRHEHAERPARAERRDGPALERLRQTEHAEPHDEQPPAATAHATAPSMAIATNASG